MKNFLRKILILNLVLVIIFSQFEIVLAQAPYVPQDYESNVNFSDVAGKILKRTVQLAGVCTGIAIGEGVIDLLGDILKKAVNKIVGIANDIIEEITNIEILETTVPTKVKNFAEYFNMEQMTNNFNRCLERFFVRYAAEVINAIGMSTLGWIQGGFQGQPLWIENFGEMLDSIADQALGQLIYEFNPAGIGQILCRGVRLEDINFVLDVYRLQPPITELPRCTLTQVYENIEDFKKSVREQFDNPYKLLEMRIHDLSYTNNIYFQRSILEAQKQRYEARLAFEIFGPNAINVEGGFISPRFCVRKDPVSGVCLESRISHPVSGISEVFKFALKGEIENLYRRAQEVKTVKDLPYLTALWIDVLANNAMVEWMKRGFQRNFVSRGSRLTQGTQVFMVESLQESGKNVVKEFTNLSIDLIKKFNSLATNFNEIITLTAEATNTVKEAENKFKFTSGSYKLEPDNLFDPAKICGIVYNANYSEKLAKDIINNIEDYASATKKLANEMKDNYSYIKGELVSKDINEEESLNEIINLFVTKNRLINQAINNLKRVDTFLKDYYSCKLFGEITENLDSLKNKLNTKISELQNCVNNLPDQNDKDKFNRFISYVSYATSTLGGFKEKDYSNEKALKASYSKLISDTENKNDECKEITQNK